LFTLLVIRRIAPELLTVFPRFSKYVFTSSAASGIEALLLAAAGPKPAAANGDDSLGLLL